MDTIQYLQIAQETLCALDRASGNARRQTALDVYLPAEKIVEAVQAMVNAGGWHLSAITGMDIPQAETIGWGNRDAVPLLPKRRCRHPAHPCPLQHAVVSHASAM